MTPEALRAAFARTGKKQKDLAAALKLDKSAVTRMMQGKQQVLARQVPIIEAFFAERIQPAPPPRLSGKSIETVVDEAVREAVDANLGSVVAILSEAVRSWLRQTSFADAIAESQVSRGEPPAPSTGKPRVTTTPVD